MSSNYSYVYILSNITDNVLYVGVTSDLVKRIYEHKNHLVAGFTHKYNVTKLVYFERSEKELVHFETFEDIEEAILREKKLKGGSREKKLKLIESNNPTFSDLNHTIS